MKKFAACLIACVFVAASQANASPFSITIGDNDGYGYGAGVLPDNGSPAPWVSPVVDNRSAAEAAATNGAQLTDVYSSVFNSFGPNPDVGSVIFNLPGQVATASLTVDMGDFQASTFGQLQVSFNGVVQPNLWNFQDGYQNTVVRTFALSAAAIANANAAGQFILTIDRTATSSGDFVAFDYFQLNGRLVPEPTSMALFGLGAAGLGFVRRRNKKVVA